MSVIDKKLGLLSNKFSKQKFMFYFYSQNNSGNNFYAVLIFYGYVIHHPMELAISLQPNCYV